MGLCTYFLVNCCRFGTQCKNEHINVRLVVKTDVDSSIKGNQWPLSCYGPFRDKPCVPNFIEDQSFEEMRLLCYDAKTNGTLPNLLNQIGQQYQEAKNKMAVLYEMDHELLNVVATMYNATEGKSNTGPPQNPFAAIGAGPTMSETSSIFGSAPTTISNPFGNPSVFGGNTVGSTVTSTNNVFGGGASSGTGIFGAASAFGSSGASLFGGGNQPTAYTNTASTGLFGQAPAPSPFSLSQIQPQAEQGQPTSSNIFGNSGTTSSVFQGNSVFGGAATFQSQPASLFGGQQAVAATGGNSIFGQNQAFGGGANNFGAAQPQQNQSIFGGSTQQSLFGVPTTVAPPPPTGLFGNVPVQAQSGANIFGAAATMPQQQQSIFGGNTVTPAAPPPNPFGTANMPFGSSVPQATTEASFSSSVFGNPTNYQSPFAATQSQDFGNNPFQNQVQAQPQPIDGTVYSKIDTLSEEELQWFNADQFVLGSIPTVPPPRELCC